MKYKNLSLLKNLTEHNTKRQYSLKDFLRQINLHSLKLKKIEAALTGIFKSNKFGTGFDFNEIREYRIGDDLRHISWSATAKTNTLQTKEYFSENEIRTYFLLDISNSMLCGNKTEQLIKLLAFLLNLSCIFSEKIGGIFFSDEIKYHLPQRESNSQANILFQTFMDFYTNINSKIQKPATGDSNTNLALALEFANRYFCKKGLIIIISDFINLNNWEKAFYNTSQKQNIYSFQIYDPIDYQIPKSGYITTIDPETNKRCFVNTDNKIIQRTYHSLMIKKQEELQKFLKSINVHHVLIEKNDF